MNWKNPIHVFALVGWQMFQTVALLVSICWRGLRFFAGLPPLLLFFFGGLWYAVWHFVRRPFPALDENPLLDLMDYHTPTFYGWVVLWYYVAPFVTVMLAGFLLMSVWKVWFESRRKRDFAAFGGLPTWPLSADQKAPGIVIGEVHHPVEAREIFNPSWLTIPERGLYTGVAIFGAVGSGKTSACMNPFARQLLGWQAANPQMRAAALVLEVKGDFCHDIRQILVEADREKDYIELGMEGRWQWNPLSAWWLDSYSLAYTVSSLLNQLFGKGKEPFWQQAYTNLVRWIIELHRVFPERWVTLQQVYRCAIDPELFAAKIEEAEKLSDDLSKGTVFVSKDVIAAQPMNLGEWVWEVAADPQKKQAAYTRPMKAKLDELGIDHRIVWEPGPGEDMRETGGSRQALVCSRLASAGQQSEVVHCGGGFGVPCHVRYAGRGEGVLPQSAERIRRSAGNRSSSPNPADEEGEGGGGSGGGGEGQGVARRGNVRCAKAFLKELDRQEAGRRGGRGPTAQAEQRGGRGPTAHVHHCVSQRRNAHGRGAPTADL